MWNLRVVKLGYGHYDSGDRSTTSTFRATAGDTDAA